MFVAACEFVLAIGALRLPPMAIAIPLPAGSGELGGGRFRLSPQLDVFTLSPLLVLHSIDGPSAHIGAQSHHRFGRPDSGGGG